MKKVLLVEPHPDDILLSLYHYIKINTFKDSFLVALSNPDRENSLNFSKDMGIKFINPLNIPDIDWGLRMKLNNIDYKNSYNIFLDYYKDYINRLEIITYKKLKKIIDSIDIDSIICPLGILHPFHVFTRYIVEKFNKNIYYYADVPYAYRVYGTKIIESSGKVYDHYKPTRKEVEDKIEAFLKYYKSQRNILLNKWNEASNLYKGEKILV